MLYNKKNKKKTDLEKKVVVDLKKLKSLENLKKLSGELNELDGEEIKGGKDGDSDTVNPQWPTTGVVGGK